MTERAKIITASADAKIADGIAALISSPDFSRFDSESREENGILPDFTNQ